MCTHRLRKIAVDGSGEAARASRGRVRPRPASRVHPLRVGTPDALRPESPADRECVPITRDALLGVEDSLWAVPRSGEIRSKGVGVGPTRDLAARRICRGRRHEPSGQCNTRLARIQGTEQLMWSRGLATVSLAVVLPAKGDAFGPPIRSDPPWGGRRTPLPRDQRRDPRWPLEPRVLSQDGRLKCQNAARAPQTLRCVLRHAAALAM